MTFYVNDEALDEREILSEIERLRPHYEQTFADQAPEEQKTQLTEWARENVVERVLLHQAACREMESLPDAELDKAYEDLVNQHGGKQAFFQRFGLEETDEAEVRLDVERRILVGRFLDRLVEEIADPTDDEIASYYEANPERFRPLETVTAAHIVKHLSPESDEKAVLADLEGVLKKLRNNASFAEMAKEHSDCPEQGGDLGTFPRGQMVEAFDDVVFSLEPGQISDVFQTEFGYHIARVESRTDATGDPAPLDTARESIAQELANATRQKAVEEFVDQEKGKATIGER